MDDPLGAFVPHGHVEIAGAAHGSLAGATFAAKDIFDVAGRVTGCGNPDWQRSHAPAERHAAAVAALLQAGATLVGKTVTDELAYSLNGQNAHYGTPANSNAPGRIPGGSSSGSASAVAGGLCDTALGSDTGGSVRIPSSYCGLYGLRPTHGRVDATGVMPLAPSFDTVGWFARDAETLERVGAVLLGEDAEAVPFERLLLAEDAWALAVPAAPGRRWRPARAPGAAPGQGGAVTVEPGDGPWMWRPAPPGRRDPAGHGAWIEATKPRIGPFLAERMRRASRVTRAQVVAAEAQRTRIRRRLDKLLDGDALLLLPSAPGPATRIDATMAEHEQVRVRTIGITCIASLGGLPQVSLPLGRLAEGPVGLSLLAGRGQDALLLDLVASALGEMRQTAAR